MAAPRSPNYPSMALQDAIDAIRPILKAEHRNKMSREVLSQHLGYSSISGRALSKMGAIRAYGLIEGQGDETRVSHDAVTCIEAPESSEDYREAILRCALRPAIFKDISEAFPTLPSEQNLRYWVIKRGFNSEAASKIVQVYLATMRLVTDLGNSYNPDPVGEAEEEWESDGNSPPAYRRSAAPPPAGAPVIQQGQPGMRNFVINLSDGKDAVLSYPADLDATGYQDLQDYLDLFFTKAKRKASVPAKGKADDDFSDLA